MEEMTLAKEGLSLAQKNMLDFFQTHDLKYVAKDAVFKNLGTGETHTGHTEIGAMLHYIYHVAFDAQLVVSSYVITEENAQVEGKFKGKHIGEIGGMAATNKDVEVPLCITYDLKDGLIKQARIYMLTDVMMQQLGVSAPAAQQKTTYLVRDIFQLKFGQYRGAKKLFDEAFEKNMLPDTKQLKLLTDFTGNAYRLILEEGFDSLADYETSLMSGMKVEEWQSWYERFKPLVESSQREILKQVV